MKNGTAYVKTVSAHQASNAVETLGNLLFWIAQHADDGIMVRKLITETQGCVTKLAQFTRPELVFAKQSRRPPNQIGLPLARDSVWTFITP
jgi:hypothetical protein